MYYYFYLVLFKSFTSTDHTYEEFLFLFFSTLPITLFVQDIIRLYLSEKITKNFEVSKLHGKTLLKVTSATKVFFCHKVALDV